MIPGDFLFRAHDQEGVPLTSMVAIGLERGHNPDLYGFAICARLKGWKDRKIYLTIRETVVDNNLPREILLLVRFALSYNHEDK
jgi:hypothetical protein